MKVVPNPRGRRVVLLVYHEIIPACPARSLPPWQIDFPSCGCQGHLIPPFHVCFQDQFSDMRISINQTPGSSLDFGFTVKWAFSRIFVASVEAGKS